MREQRYIILFNETYREYNDKNPVEIGRIIDTNNEDRIVSYIIFDKNDYLENNYRCRGEITETKEGNEIFIIYVNETYKNLLYNKYKIFCAIALHELGHYLNGDLNENNGMDTAQISQERLNCILNNKVLPMELNADKFAVNEIGKSTMNSSIDYLIKLRKERNDPGMQLAIKEFELRKKAIKNI